MYCGWMFWVTLELRKWVSLPVTQSRPIVNDSFYFFVIIRDSSKQAMALPESESVFLRIPSTSFDPLFAEALTGRGFAKALA